MLSQRSRFRLGDLGPPAPEPHSLRRHPRRAGQAAGAQEASTAWPAGVTAALTARTGLGILRGQAGCARGLPPTHVRAPRSATAGRSPAGHRPSGTGCPDAASPGKQKEQVRSRLHTAPVPTGLCRATTFSAAFWQRAWGHARTSRPQIWRPSSISPVPWQWCGCSYCDNRTATIVRKLVGLRAATRSRGLGQTARTHGRPRSPS
jgi:hypothetical protein